RGITTFFTSLTAGGDDLEKSEVGISSLIDTWLKLEVVQSGGESNRTVSIVKSRGMPHSNQTSEFVLGARGVRIADTYLGASGVLTGSARVAKEAEDEAAAQLIDTEIARKQKERKRRRRQVEAQILSLRESLDGDDADLARAIQEDPSAGDRLKAEMQRMARSRHAFVGHGAHDRSKARRGGKRR